jgi:hypothetical protein
MNRSLVRILESFVPNLMLAPEKMASSKILPLVPVSTSTVKVKMRAIELRGGIPSMASAKLK